MYYVLCAATIERYGRQGLNIYIYVIIRIVKYKIQHNNLRIENFLQQYTYFERKTN